MRRLQEYVSRVRRDGLDPVAFQRVCVVALVAVCAIVVTGAAVRLTGSGLGCEDWPNCNNTRLLDVGSKHAAIEQINRLFTFVVGLAVVLAAAGALVRRPRRRDLTVPAMLLVAGVPAQALVGALVIWTKLNPAAVQLHMVLSLILVGVAVVLVVRSRRADGATMVSAVVPSTARLVKLLAMWTGAALLSGTVVTGTGPHAGDEEAKRFWGTSTDVSGTALTWVTRVHSVIVWITVAIALRLLWSLRARARDRAALDAPLSAWMITAIVQGAVGYWQYATGVPAGLVAIHVFGATTLSGVTVWLWLSTRRPVASVDSQIDQALADARAARTTS